MVAIHPSRRSLVAMVGGGLLLAGCSSSPSSQDTGTRASSTPHGPAATPSNPGNPAASDGTAPATIIDVRTPGEYDEGHLEGAVNIDFSASDFTEQIAALDPAATYQVYCRSGNRSAQAVAAMQAAGFTNVSDLGGIQDASETTGLRIVSS